MTFKGLLMGAAAAAAIATGAQAADATQEQIASKFDVAFGAAVTTQYVSRGVRQSDGFAVQGYIEPSYGMFYAGVWASNVGPAVAPTAPSTLEVDLYAGIRPTFGNLSLDFGYAQYLLNNGAGPAGEIYGKASYAFNDVFTGGLELYQDVWNNATYGAVTGEVALPANFKLSAALGSNFTTGNVDWNAGVGYTFADTVTLDLRYHGTNGIDDPAFGDRIVATLSLDTAISKLMQH